MLRDEILTRAGGVSFQSQTRERLFLERLESFGSVTMQKFAEQQQGEQARLGVEASGKCKWVPLLVMLQLSLFSESREPRGDTNGVPDRLRSGDLLHERRACWLNYTTGTESEGGRGDQEC